MVILVAGVLVVFILLPMTAGSKGGPSKLTCLNNLRKVGMSFQLFATDHHGRFPAQLSTNEGGTWEYGGLAAAHFAALYPQDFAPSLLICPSDTRGAAKDLASLGNSNLSYFVNLDASELGPGMIMGDQRDPTFGPKMVLVGHRNLMVDGQTVQAGLVCLTNGQSIGWNAVLHSNRSATLFVDGSVILASQLTLATNHLSTNFVNRLAVP